MEAGSVKLEPRFETRAGFKFAGIIIEGCADTGEIPGLWDKFLPLMHDIPNRVNENVCYGIINPYGPKQENNVIDYACAVEVSSFDDLPEGMVSGELPDSYYAVFTHKGPISKFSETIQYVFGDWVKNSGYTLLGKPELEIYNEKFKGDAKDSECYIYIPVQEK